MPKPKALTDVQAKNSLANKFGPLADRLRQLNTKYGIRPYRVFLVWVRSSGAERGEGIETEFKRIELLPTPKVSQLDAMNSKIVQSGTMAAGSLRLTEISITMTFDTLSGYLHPDEKEKVPDPYDFFYEVVEDGRHGGSEQRRKFRVGTDPALLAGKIGWSVGIERIDEDRDRAGNAQPGPDVD